MWAYSIRWAAPLLAWGLAVVCVGEAFAANPSKDARDGGAQELIDTLANARRADARREGNALVITGKEHGQQAELWTRGTYAVPLVITLEGKADSKSIRLFYGENGVLIFNWELNPNELRFHDPRTREQSGIGGAGRVAAGTWVTVRWTFTEDEVRAEVDGEERYSRRGNFRGIAGAIGVGTYDDGHVSVRSLRVSRPSAKSPDKSPPAPAASEPTAGPVEVEVPMANAPAGKAPAVPAADFMKIEAPEYARYPKRLDKAITSIRAMTVIEGEDGQATGMTTDIIATVPPASRNGKKAGAGFFRPDGDPTMKTSFEEALRAVQFRYPLWQPGHIDFSFGEKFTAHAGPSAGTAFAVLTLSCLEGFEIDPKCAITGDVSVDWRVRKVGGVTAKLRGAALDKCLIAAIPEENSGAFTDMALLYGNHAMWDLQVFSIANLQQALAVARTDRPEKMAEAIRLFADLQPQLAKAEKVTLHSPATRERLKRVLELAPNHLSAQRVLALCDGTAPKTLSAGATDYQLSVLLHPYLAVFANEQALSRETLPRTVTLLARKRLDALRPIANKDYQPALREVGVFIETIDQLASQSIAASTAKARIEAVVAHLGEMGSDPELMGKLYRDGY